MIRITFLGTAAARPTVGRGVSALALQRGSELLLFDCGEGTQRQMMRFGTGFGVDAIFFTHVHADHLLGLTGLLRTMGLQGRTSPIQLFGPRGSGRVLRDAAHLGVERLPFQVSYQELEPDQPIRRDGYDLLPFQVEHRTPAVGFALKEDLRLGRFDVERARAMGVPEGPLFGRLHRGEPVEVDGRVIEPGEVVGPSRPGRLVVLSGDTRPCARTSEVARDADLLVHEATFGEEEELRALDTGHSTAREAALVARTAGVKRLILTHISARYSDCPHLLEAEAQAVFTDSTVAHDGLTVEVPFPDQPPVPKVGEKSPSAARQA